MADPTLDAEIAGQKLKYSGPLNTLVTVLTFCLVLLLGYILWAHQSDTKDASAAFVGALKEQTKAMVEGTAVAREQNCLLKFEQKDRPANADFCAQVSGVRIPR